MVGLCGCKKPTNQTHIPDNDLNQRLKEVKEESSQKKTLVLAFDLESVLP